MEPPPLRNCFTLLQASGIPAGVLIAAVLSLVFLFGVVGYIYAQTQGWKIPGKGDSSWGAKEGSWGNNNWAWNSKDDSPQENAYAKKVSAMEDGGAPNKSWPMEKDRQMNQRPGVYTNTPQRPALHQSPEWDVPETDSDLAIEGIEDLDGNTPTSAGVSSPPSSALRTPQSAQSYSGQGLALSGPRIMSQASAAGDMHRVQSQASAAGDNMRQQGDNRIHSQASATSGYHGGAPSMWNSQGQPRMPPAPPALEWGGNNDDSAVNRWKNHAGWEDQDNGQPRSMW